MRFGKHSHDIDPETVDPGEPAECARLVRTLRDLAERIEQANLPRASESLTSIAAAVEPLRRTVERVLGVSVSGRARR